MKRHLAHLLWLLPLAAFLLIRYGLVFNGLYGQDAHEYYRYGKAMYEFFRGGEHPGAFFWPVIYPGAGAALACLLRDPLLALQGISVLAFAGTAGLLYSLLQHLHRAKNMHALLFVVLFFSLSPLCLNAAHVVMSDMLAAFLVMLAVYSLLRLENHFSLFWLLLCAFSAAAACSTRYAAVVLLFPAGLRVLYLGYTHKAWGALLSALLLACLVLVPHFLLKEEKWSQFLQSDIFLGWHPLNLFRRRMESPSGMFSYPLPNLLYTFYHAYHPGYLFVGALLVAGVQKQDFASALSKTLLACVLLYALFIAGIPLQNKRFLLISFPMLLMLLYPSFQRLWQRFVRGKGRILVPGALVAVQLFIFLQVFKPLYRFNQLQESVATALHSRPERVVYAFALDPAIRSYGIPQEVRNLWTEAYTDFEPGALVLFNEPLLAEQWKGRNPMINWEKLRRQHRLDTLRHWEGGWTLYRIE